MSGKTAGASWRSKLSLRQAAVAAPANAMPPDVPAAPPPLADITMLGNQQQATATTGAKLWSSDSMQSKPASVVTAPATVTASAAAASLPLAEQAVAPAHAMAGTADSSDDEMPQFDILGCVQQEEAAQAAEHQHGRQQQRQQQALGGQPEEAAAAPAPAAAPGVAEQPPPQQQPAPAEDDGWGSPMLPASLHTVAAPTTGTGNADGSQPTTRSRSTGRQRRMQRIFDDELDEPLGVDEQRQRSRMHETLTAEPAADLSDSGSDPDLHWSKPRPPRPAVAAGVAAANAAFAVRGLKRLRRAGDAGGSSGAARPLQPMQLQQQLQQQQQQEQQQEQQQQQEQEQQRGECELSPEQPRSAQRGVLALTASRPAAAEQEQPARKPRGNPFARLGASASRVMLATHQPVPGAGAGSLAASQFIAGLFDGNEGSCAAAAIEPPMLPAPPRQKPFKPPARLEGPAQQRREQQQQQMQGGGEVIDLSGLPDSSAPAAGSWQQQRQPGGGGWHTMAVPPPQVQPQPFWQAPEEEDEQDGWGVPGMQQQQQQQQLQTGQPFWQVPDDDDDNDFAAGPSLPPAGWQAGAAAGGGGGDGSGQQPWWARLPDFVPVAALHGGRDPRDGAQVFIDYRRQFSGQTGGGATTAARAAARAAGATHGGGGRSQPRKMAAAAAGASPASGAGRWINEGVRRAYIDASGRRLYGRIAHAAYRREKDSGGDGGGRQRKSGGGSKSKFKRKRKRSGSDKGGRKSYK